MVAPLPAARARSSFANAALSEGVAMAPDAAGTTGLPAGVGGWTTAEAASCRFDSSFLVLLTDRSCVETPPTLPAPAGSFCAREALPAEASARAVRSRDFFAAGGRTWTLPDSDAALA